MTRVPVYLPTVPAWRAVLEALVFSLALTSVMVKLAPSLQPFPMQNATFLIVASAGFWCALRWQWSDFGGWRYLLRAGACGLACSIATGAGIGLVASILGWNAAFANSRLGVNGTLLVMALSGPTFAVTRAAMHLWRAWDQLRRKHLVWSLTHAQLSIALFVIAAGSLLLTVLMVFNAPVPDDTSKPFPLLTNRLLVTLVPATGILAVLGSLTLLLLLPPSALFSFWFARRTTRRLEKLTAATGALRAGRYSTRVPVVGEDEIAALQSDFNAMANDLELILGELQAERDRVSALLQSRRELFANVSHELRTPVATIRSYAESALQNGDALPAERRHDLEVIDAETRHLEILIADLFTLARVDAGHLALDCRATDVGPVIQRIVDALAPIAWQTGRVELVARMSPHLPCAWVDASRVDQVLANLLRNGIRHTSPGGIVAVEVGVETDAVVVTVRDTGEGIAPEDLQHIWERFYQGHSVRDGERSGAGLGLALVKEWVEAMGGTVSVESELGRGSSFAVRLPRAGASTRVNS